MLDVVNLSMLLVVIALRVWILYLLNILNFNPPPNQFSDFHNPAWSIYQVSNIMALTAILARVRVGVT